MSEIIFVRHGETEKNVEGILHSHDDMEPLTQRGTEQMVKVAEALKGHSPTHIFCSSEARAIESAKFMAEKLGLPFEVRDDLQERNWGELSGRRWTEVDQMLSSMPFDKRYVYKPEGGESWQEFETRLEHAITGLLGTYIDQTLIIVTHEGAIRALTPFLLGIPKEGSYEHSFANGSITILKNENAKLHVEVVNDVSHL